MLTWLKIASRNLYKNRRRSLFTIAAIALGYGAVNIFGGFTAYVFDSLKESYIYGRGTGDITVFKRGLFDEGRIDPLRFLMDKDEADTVRELVEKQGIARIATAQITISGLMSDGEISTVFIASGRVPSEYHELRSLAEGVISRIDNYSGAWLNDDSPYGIAVSEGLAAKLGQGKDGTAILSSPTVDGMVNALDVEIVQTFQAGSEMLNDKLILVPLTLAQELYQTNAVEQINILLRKGLDTKTARQQLEDQLRAAGLDVEVWLWEQLVPSYFKIKNMFDIIFSFIFVIVFTIAAMSIVNTINMAVMERTREIGTLRALGANRSSIVQLFSIEGALLGFAGILGGLLLTFIAWAVVLILEPSWIPPQFTSRIPLEIYLLPANLLITGLIFLALALVAAIPPSLRISRQGIVDSLGHA